MGILDDFGIEKNTTAKVFAYKKTRNAAGNVISGYETVSKGSVTGFTYQSASSKRIINEKYKQDVDSLFIADPAEVLFTIDEKDRIVINGKNYEILFVENIGNLGEVLQIALKKG